MHILHNSVVRASRLKARLCLHPAYLFQNSLVEYLRIFYENIIFNFIESIVVVKLTTI